MDDTIIKATIAVDIPLIITLLVFWINLQSARASLKNSDQKIINLQNELLNSQQEKYQLMAEKSRLSEKWANFLEENEIRKYAEAEVLIEAYKAIDAGTSKE